VDLTLLGEIVIGLSLFGLLLAIWSDQRYSRTLLLPKISEKPMFVALRVPPCDDVERVRFSTRDGKMLEGIYARHTSGSRRGVLVFCHEYLADRWSFQVYADGFRDAGFDIFSFDFRNHGESETDPQHPSLPWLTNLEFLDLEAALDYLQCRPDRDPNGFALFGVSRGGSAALAMAARRHDVWAVVTDGAFPTVGTLIPFMRRFAALYVNLPYLVDHLPRTFLKFVAYRGITKAERKFGCRFLHLESLVSRIGPRPWFAIHGETDSYISVQVARELFSIARESKQLWVVPKAKHNRSQQVQPEEYRERIVEFLATNAPAHVETEQTSAFERNARTVLN
jgi:pimeloyl-ACP methyl ester carboxylesterase